MFFGPRQNEQVRDRVRERATPRHVIARWPVLYGLQHRQDDGIRRLARLIFTGDPLPRYVQLPPPARAALTGLYEIGPGATRTIFEQGDTLFSRREQGAPQALAALSETELTLHESEGAVTFSFEPGPNGHAAVVRAALRCEPINVGRR
jgi:hypothetical protein